MHFRSALLAVVSLTFTLVAAPALAVPTQFTVDTTSLSGSSGGIAFDFIDGGTPSNSVIISNFSTDGLLGGFVTEGAVQGSLPAAVSLFDTSFFNEYLSNIVFGKTLTFILDFTSNAAAEDASPDAFAMFLLDGGGTGSLVSTTDPTGADAIFVLRLGDPIPLDIYSSNEVAVTTALVVGQVPEANEILLLLEGLLALGLVVGKRRRNSALTDRGITLMHTRA